MAFLIRELARDICEDTSGYPRPQQGNKVCKVKRLFMILNNLLRPGRFSQAMENLGYHQANGDHIMFSKHSSIGKTNILVVYVDDIIIAANGPGERAKIRKESHE